MYKEVVKGTEYELLSDSTITMMMEQIRISVIESLESRKASGPIIIGCLAWHDIKLKDGTIKNMYIEYDAKILPVGMVDAGINYMIIYDEIPDLLLDRLSKLKSSLISETITIR